MDNERQVSPNYKGKHPKSKEELARIRAEKKQVYECKDPAVNPNHYKSKNGLEVIDCIEAFTADLTGIEAVCVANILKYICRYKKKNGLQDCRKAAWFVNKLIKHLEEQEQEKKYEKKDIPRGSNNGPEQGRDVPVEERSEEQPEG